MSSTPNSIAKLLSINHVNFYVLDASVWQRWFEFYLDFKTIGQTIANSSIGDTFKIILQQGQFQIHISESLNRHSRVAKYLENHPQGIGEIGFRVQEPATEMIPSWGDIVHTFVSGTNPTNSNQAIAAKSSKNLFTAIDHVVINADKVAPVAAWYAQNLGLVCGESFAIETANSALRSVVMKSGNHSVQNSGESYGQDSGETSSLAPIQIPLNEPSTPNSQIQEFLNYNGGAGVQHLALLTDDIETAVDKLRARGLDFLETSPPILVEDQDLSSKPRLLQIFTKPIFGEPTFFLEIIQRQNQAQGFGAKNFQALFEAVERQQLTPTIPKLSPKF